MIHWQNDNHRLYHEDFLTNSLPDNSVDLVVTSPPYNLGMAYGTYEDASSYEAYLDFSRAWLNRAYAALKPDGRLCLNVAIDTNKGGARSLSADMTTLAQAAGLHYHTTIVWNENNMSRRTAWGSFMSASAPYVIAPVEMIIVLYKQQWKKLARGVSDIAREEFIAWTNGLWTFGGESKKRIGHPAPFPLELPYRCIKLFSYVGDTVLDPFAGSGTTLVSCLANNRVALGYEIDLTYCELAAKRLGSSLDALKVA